MLEPLAAHLQNILPQHWLSGLVYRLMRVRNRTVKNLLIRLVGSAVGVDWSEARLTSTDDYTCFNDFFTRELKPGARPLDPNSDALASPCDGKISEAGYLEGGKILQAKGIHYELSALLGGDPLALELSGGAFCTIYLSPKDYHRVHMPLDGRLLRMLHVPGRLFSVAPYTVRNIPNLFARNERIVTLFDTPRGPFAQVLVGAMLVGSMSTVWAGQVTPDRQAAVRQWDYSGQDIRLARGEEMGRFNMGSTVILVMPPDLLDPSGAWPEPGQGVRQGQRLARLRTVQPGR